MRRRLFLGMVTGLAATLLVTAVLALVSRAPTHDAYVDTNEASATHNAMGLAAEGSDSGCTPTRTIYMQWDLSDISAGRTISAAELSLHATFVSSTGSSMLSLFETGDGWSEDTLNDLSTPGIGNVLETVVAPQSAPATVTFSSDDLTAYLNTEAAGDDVVSFVLRFSNGCPPADTAFVLFADRESGADGPALQTSLSCILGDVNCDCTVNANDLADTSLIWRYGSTQPEYDADRDVNDDGVVNTLDLMIIAKQLGTDC